MNDLIEPNDLARELGFEGKNPGKAVRQFLRDNYERPESEYRKRWFLTPEQADSVRAHFRARKD